MYEHRKKPLISTARFRLRVAVHILAAAGVVLLSALLGTLGFMVFEGMSWTRAWLNAATLLSGLGLAEIPQTPAAQIFVSAFAFFSGFVFLTASAMVVAPVLHRLIHRFHWDDDSRP